MIAKDMSCPRKRESIIRIPRFPIKTYFDSAQHEFGNDKFKYFVITILLILFNACSSTKDLSEYENVTGTFIETGIASWYGPNFEGRQTANGEIFDMNKLYRSPSNTPIQFSSKSDK